MNMGMKVESVLALHERLLNNGKTINLNAQQLKLRIQKNSVQPVEPNNLREIAAKLCKDYIDWMMGLPRFYERIPLSDRKKRSSLGADPVLMRAWVGGGTGTFVNDIEMLWAIEDILNESRNKLEELCDLDPLKALQSRSVLSIKTNSDEVLVIGYEGASSTPFSKDDQYVVAFEYILLDAQEYGLLHAISKSEIWQYLLQRHEKQPFECIPEAKKGSNLIRNSIDRHLKRIEKNLKMQFPTLKEKKLFQPADKEGCILLCI